MEENKEFKAVRTIHLEETYHELVADYTALRMIHDSWGSEDYDPNALEHLWWDRLSLLEQHITDIAALCGFSK